MIFALYAWSETCTSLWRPLNTVEITASTTNSMNSAQHLKCELPLASFCPVRRWSALHPCSVAIKRGGDTVNYRQLDNQVSMLVVALQRAGVSKGDRVICRVNDLSRMVPLFFAALRATVILVPISPKYPEDYAQTLYAHSNPQLVLDDTGLQQLMVPVEKGRIDSDRHDVVVDALAPFTGIFTSGSSGHPKLVLHSFKNHYASAMGSQVQIPLQAGDCWALTLPLHHVSGLAILMRVIIAGATLALSDGETLTDLITTQNVTHLSAVPSQLERLRESSSLMRNATLRYLLVGGAICSATLLYWLQAQNWQVFISYGMTETASQVMTGPANSEGVLRRCLPYQQITIANSGEILVRGDTLFLGYWHNGRVDLPLDTEGWFHTRDIGQLTDKGLQVAGRLDSQFISGGENIQPEEIERQIYALLAVEQCIVVPKPDAIYGSVAVCFLSLLPDATGIAQLQQQLSLHLPAFKVPRKFYALEARDREQLKVSRQNLVQRLLNMP